MVGARQAKAKAVGATAVFVIKVRCQVSKCREFGREQQLLCVARQPQWQLQQQQNYEIEKVGKKYEKVVGGSQKKKLNLFFKNLNNVK